MNKPQLWIAAGPNGAGKSTFARRRLLDRMPIVNPDEFTAAHSLIEAGRMALKARERLIATRKSFAIETTLAGHGEIALIRRTKAAGYKINLVFIGLKNPDLAVSRVALRAQAGGHNVARDDILRRYDRSLSNLVTALQLADRAWVIDNSDKRQRLLLTRDAQHVRHLSANMPEWAVRPLSEHLREIGSDRQIGRERPERGGPDYER